LARPTTYTPLNKIVVAFILLLFSVTGSARQVHTLTDRPTASIHNIEVLPDDNYDWQEIQSDSGLTFVSNDSLRPGLHTTYWYKIYIHNPFPEARSFALRVQPALHNTLYYFDANAGQWVNDEGGLQSITHTGRVGQDILEGVLRSKAINILYIKAVIGKPAQTGRAFMPQVTLEKASIANQQEKIIWITWVTSLVVLFLFLLNNVYIYFSFKDKTILYYLVAQVGGIIYITAYKQVFPVLFPCPLLTTGITANGQPAWYDLNDLLMHIGIGVIMYGIVQFSRHYLKTRQWMPRLDSLLKYGLYGYLAISSLFMLINAGLLYTENEEWLFENIITGVLFAAVIAAGIIAYMRKLPAASPFLLANVISLGFMLATTLYHLLVEMDEVGYPLVKSLLPDLAIITLTFGFSVALVARTRLIQKSLLAKEAEARQLEFDLREIALRQSTIEFDNQQINAAIRHEKIRNEDLQEKLEINQRELASSTLYIVQKNEMLASLKTQIKELSKLYPDKQQQELQDIESTLQDTLYLKADWEKFKLHFEQVHPHFFENLTTQHPSLTNNEIRLYAYFHIKLSTKEIAALLNIDPASVRRAKTRLYKKMGVNSTKKGA
jgi:DNA-binding CsgD family transcriptional regulator